MVPKRTKTKSFPTPLIQDVLFFETGIDRSLSLYKDLQFGDPHYDKDRWPDHYLVDVQPSPERGDETFTFFWAARRKDQDKYNWEHSKADLGGTRYDSIMRSYVELRSEYRENTPKLGTVMPDVPVGKFSYADFILIARQQSRISERGRRSQATIGSPEMDSMFIVEMRTYVKRSSIVSERYDPSTNGPLYTTQTFYVRGEIYSGVDKIEDAVNNATYWVPTDSGQVSEFQQVSTDVWVVTTQDLIPQSGLPAGAAKFGGTFLRSYETSITYPWPDVLGDDGNGYDAVDITQWAYKTSGYRTYIRPVYKRYGYRGPCKAVMHEEWLSASQMAAATASSAFDVLTLMEPERIYYIAPYLPINIPPCLHGAIYLQSDTGTNDPTWGQNVGSRRDFAATNYTDWPDSIVCDVNVSPSRGGYLVRHVTCYKPQTYEPPA